MLFLVLFSGLLIAGDRIFKFEFTRLDVDIDVIQVVIVIIVIIAIIAINAIIVFLVFLAGSTISGSPAVIIHRIVAIAI